MAVPRLRHTGCKWRWMDSWGCSSRRQRDGRESASAVTLSTPGTCTSRIRVRVRSCTHARARRIAAMNASRAYNRVNDSTHAMLSEWITR